MREGEAWKVRVVSGERGSIRLLAHTGGGFDDVIVPPTRGFRETF